MRPKLAAALIVVGIAALPACSQASKVTTSQAAQAQAAPKPRITMKPSTGRSRTHFVVSFTAPDRTGKVGGSVRRYQVSARTTAHHGCVWTAFASVSTARNGARVGAVLVPQGGGSWCAGTFHGRIIETLQPPCPPLKLCPAFIGVIRTVGTFTFRVKADRGGSGGSVSSGSALSPSPCIPATYSARSPARPGATCG